VAQPKQRLITAEDLYQFELVSQARLSPDGKMNSMDYHEADELTGGSFV
jgi:hypothetical protein